MAEQPRKTIDKLADNSKKKRKGHQWPKKRIWEQYTFEKKEREKRRKSAVKKKQNQFTCKHPECEGECFSNFTQYRLHDRVHHSKIRPYQCKFCPENARPFRTLGAIKYHLKKKENKQTIDSKKLVEYCKVDKQLLDDEKDRLKKAEHNSTSGKDSKTSKQNAKTESSSSFPSSSSSSASSSTSVPAETNTTTTTTTITTKTTKKITTTTTTTTTSEPHQKKLTTNKSVSKGDRQCCPKCGIPLKYSSMLPPNKEAKVKKHPYRCSFPSPRSQQPTCTFTAAEKDDVLEHVICAHFTGRQLRERAESGKEENVATKVCGSGKTTARGGNGRPLSPATPAAENLPRQYIHTEEEMMVQPLKLLKLPCSCSSSAAAEINKRGGGGGGEEEKEEGKSCSRRKNRRRRNSGIGGGGGSGQPTDTEAAATEQRESYYFIAAGDTSQRECLAVAADSRTTITTSSLSHPAKCSGSDTAAAAAADDDNDHQQIRGSRQTPFTERAAAELPISSPPATRATTTAAEKIETDNCSNKNLFQLEYFHDDRIVTVDISQQLTDLLDEVKARGPFLESISWICPFDGCTELTFACWEDFCLHLRKMHFEFRPYRCTRPGCTEEPAHLKSAIIQHYKQSHQLTNVSQEKEEEEEMMTDDWWETVEQPGQTIDEIFDGEIRMLKRWWSSDKYQNLVMSRAIKLIEQSSHQEGE
ncbi:hypothetical protein TYRP_020126 [Tyrophagus putrescentiae]|nr:hypothetical protein TYRP_020126 [Tyrophagus putrescentiae]